ncbi:ATPase/histidine kinase/DNA gyrase B/HSP90 domain-containing protein [Toxoplasma gondii RUB]|uniref:Protein-serine/threonine kinase n=1 Tax=Toxoplasma gondii RUB TaxID=935652 RepID=A0A086LS06_TOXGO|nr:ATPase/histidine kinase/DNA gyrase B/HSP90 domain-containing protein [Toxoplasma gondii RUB]
MYTPCWACLKTPSSRSTLHSSSRSCASRLCDSLVVSVFRISPDFVCLMLLCLRQWEGFSSLASRAELPRFQRSPDCFPRALGGIPPPLQLCVSPPLCVDLKSPCSFPTGELCVSGKVTPSLPELLFCSAARRAPLAGNLRLLGPCDPKLARSSPVSPPRRRALASLQHPTMVTSVEPLSSLPCDAGVSAAPEAAEVDVSAWIRRHSQATKSVCHPSRADSRFVSTPRQPFREESARAGLWSACDEVHPLRARAHFRSSCPDLLRIGSCGAAQTPPASPLWLSRKRKACGKLQVSGGTAACGSDDVRFRSCASISSLCRRPTWEEGVLHGFGDRSGDKLDAGPADVVDACGEGELRTVVSPPSDKKGLVRCEGDGAAALAQLEREETPATHASSVAASPFGDSASTRFSDRGDCALSPFADEVPSPSLFSEASEGGSLGPAGPLGLTARVVPLGKVLGPAGLPGQATWLLAQALFPAPPAPYLAQLLQLEDVYEAAFLAVEVLPERYLQRIHQLDALQSLVGPELYTRCSRLAAVRAIYVESCDRVTRCREEMMTQLVEEATVQREKAEAAEDDEWPPEDAFSAPLVRSSSASRGCDAGGACTQVQRSEQPQVARDPRATLRRLSEQLQAVKLLQGQVGPDLLAGMAQLVAELCRESGENTPEQIREFVDQFLHAFFSCRVAAELQREHFLTAVDGQDCGAILASHVTVEQLICRAALDAQELSLHHLGVAPPVEIFVSEPRTVDEELKAFLLAASRSEGPLSVGWTCLSSPAPRGDAPQLGTWTSADQSPIASPSDSVPTSPLGESPRETGLPGTVRFPCVSSYAYSGVFELVKNAMRASVDSWTEREALEARSEVELEEERILETERAIYTWRTSRERGSGIREEGGTTWRSTSSSLSSASLAAGNAVLRGPWSLLTVGRSRRLRKLPGRQLESCEAQRDGCGGRTRVVVLEEDAPSSVKVNLVVAFGSLLIQVEDTGRGLAEDELAKIWSFAYSTAHGAGEAKGPVSTGMKHSGNQRKDEGGEQGDKGEKDDKQEKGGKEDDSDEAVPVLAGCGVGLPISRVHAQSLGGDIFIESAKGVGTCAYMCLSNLQAFRNEALKTQGRNHRELLDRLEVRPLSRAQTSSMLASTPPPVHVKARGVGSLSSAFSQLG